MLMRGPGWLSFHSLKKERGEKTMYELIAFVAAICAPGAIVLSALHFSGKLRLRPRPVDELPMIVAPQSWPRS
jgi:hypothetical protein